MHLFQKTEVNGIWSDWIDLEGILTSEPAAVSTAEGVIDVFGRGRDFKLYQRHFDSGGWQPWQQISGGPLLSGVAVASDAAGTMDLFAAGIDMSLQHRNWNGTAWSNWESLGGRLIFTPAATSPSPGKLFVAGVGTDTALWSRTFDGTAWSSWQSSGGRLTHGPATSSSVVGETDVFGVGTDMALYHQHWNGGQWAGWQGLGGQLTSDVSASASTVTGRTDVFGRGTDNALWHQSGAGGVFSGWESLGGLLLGSLDPVTLNVPIVKQTMNLDCETAALQMALWAYGHYYSQAELFSLEKPDTRAPITSNGLIVYWGDPYTNFVGDVNGTDHFPPTGYGIYYPLILSIAQSHGAPSSTGGESNSVSSVYGALMAGKPVLTWVEVGWFHPAVHYWKAWDGRSIRYTLDEHTVTLSGLTLTQVRVNDPWHGTQYWVSRGTFERSFADFNNMAVIVTP